MASLILVVDDNPDVVQVVSAILRKKSYETVTATSGPEALRLMEERRPALILCDIMMPEMDGFQVFQRVRADWRWRAIPFAFVTALHDTDTRLSSSEMGVEAFISKPFDTQELVSVVAGLLRRAQELQTYTVSEMESFKSQLLFMITHELNTPLSVIRMLTDSMHRNLKRLNADQLSEYVGLLARSTGDLSYIVESMLLAIQIDSGRAARLYETWAAPHPLRVLIEAVVVKAEHRARERDVVIDLTGFEVGAWVHGHEEQLMQVFGRVLDNAIRFSSKGETVGIHLETDDQRAHVTFTDRGPGMTSDEIIAAFDRLRQINRAQQEQQGVGLSLGMVRSLTRIHGGEITATSTPGQGSSFTVSLPLIEAPRY
ncbi:MAG: hypothetical protein CVU38_06990 [Chloroflexi bacterium HGW-Chloroflexi-1]|nr:MAG: hypothetical protein CVU38_06990 [Chloroflexi bacterium HGW-Chloroflexi-1]